MAITRITPPTTTRPIVTERLEMTQEMRTWFQTITDRTLILGEGSPEGVVEAVEGATYQDRNGTASAIRYAKRDADIGGDTTQGWILI